ncbi:MAG: tetratricopeptide repeat protein [Candidatus Methylomirabilales bacterium]
MKARPGWRTGTLRNLLGTGLALLLGLYPVAVSAEPVSLAWDPNPEADLAGYKVYIGTSSQTYTQTIDVGHVTTYTAPDLVPGETYYFAITAYDIFANESGFSTEVSTTIPDVPPPVPDETAASNPSADSTPQATASAPTTGTGSDGSSKAIGSSADSGDGPTTVAAAPLPLADTSSAAAPSLDSGGGNAAPADSSASVATTSKATDSGGATDVAALPSGDTGGAGSSIEGTSSSGGPETASQSTVAKVVDFLGDVLMGSDDKGSPRAGADSLATDTAAVGSSKAQAGPAAVAALAPADSGSSPPGSGDSPSPSASSAPAVASAANTRKGAVPASGGGGGSAGGGGGGGGGSSSGGSTVASFTGSSASSAGGVVSVGPSDRAPEPAKGLAQKILAALGLRGAREREVEAENLYRDGRQLYEQGRFDEAILTYERAEGLYRGLAAPKQLARVAQNLGTAYYHAERYEDALGAYGKALRLYRKLGDRKREARVLDQLGTAYEALGEYVTAAKRYRASLEIWRALGQREEAAAVLERLGAAQAAAGGYAEALKSYHRSLALSRKLGKHEKLEELQTVIADVERLARQGGAGLGVR